jgi:cellulose synthase (UDP-forming)
LPLPPIDEATAVTEDATRPLQAEVGFDAPVAPPPPGPVANVIDGLVATILASPLRAAAVVALCLFPLVTYIFVDLPPRAHIVLSMALVAAGLVVANRFPHLRLVIVFLSVSASLRYVLFRGTETLALRSWGDTVTSILLYVAELYALVTLIAGYFQTAIVRRNRPVPLDLPPTELPTVDVFIPTYNEPPDVLLPTILGALAMDYPNKRVWVLDDGRREEIRALCARVGAGYLDRPDNKGAKAGNINAALPRTEGALIAFFDADHVPVRGFLSQTVGFFLENDRLALVQTPHHFYNPDPFVRNLYLGDRVPPEQHLFQLGNDFWNSAFFCGSCAVIRRQALEEVGGMSHQTVTEDAHTALQMHARGWDSLFLDVPLAAGLATETYAQHIGQRIRWARGMAQILRTDNPLIKPGLSLAQRLNYFNAATHFFFGLPRLAFVITPALYLLFGLHPVDADVKEVLVYAVPHLVLVNLGSVTVHRNVRHSIWPEVYEVAIAPYTALVTFLALLAPKRGKFNVTPKGSTVDAHSFDLARAWPLVVVFGMLLAGLATVPFQWRDHPLDHFTIGVAAAWNVYNLIIVGAAVMSAYERPQRRRFHRIERKVRVRMPAVDGGPELEGESLDVSQGGVRFVVSGLRPVPAQTRATLTSPTGRVAELDAAVLQAVDLGDGRTEIRLRFTDDDAAQDRALAEVLFSDSDTWTHDRFRFDGYWASLYAVLLSMLAALFRKPDLVERWGPGRDAPTESLVPGAFDHRCHACGAAVLEGAHVCEACGAILTSAEDPIALPVPLPPPRARRGVGALVAPVALALIASTLAVGWQPAVDLFSDFMPRQRWEQVTYQTRVGQLAQGWEELHAHFELQRRAVTLGREMPVDWSNKLWGIQRDYKLYRGGSGRSETEDIHAALSQAVLEMADLDKLYRNRAESAVIDARVRSIETHFDTAREKLRMP